MKIKYKKLLIEVIIIVLIIFGYIIVNENISNKNSTSFVFMEDDRNYAHQVEDVLLDDYYLIVKGWFFELQKVYNEEHEVLTDKKVGILLYDLNKEITELSEEESVVKHRGKAMSVDEEKRNDVNAYFECEFDYSDSGFNARILRDEVDLENGEYEIIIKPDSKGEIGLHSYAFIDKGKLVYTNPKEKMVLDVVGTALEQIVKNGICLVSCPAYHMSVYQYKNKLYWIADENYEFSTDGNTYIQYHLDTTQFDRLPDERTSNGWYWDNIGDYFETNEITDNMDCGKYRVSVRDIPSGYAITRAVTGFYDDDWVWIRMFRPVNMF